ncbi:MAG: CHRD domain-containing protein, partial [Gemmatimonadaceae bacterium]
MRRTVGITAGVVSAIALVLVAASCGDSTSSKAAIYTATLAGANERPQVTSAGTGTVTFVDLGSEIDYTLQFDGLTNVTMSHIHGPADVNTSTGVIYNLFIPNTATGAARSITVTGELTNAQNQNVSLDSLRTLFNNGKAYVNVHTSANPSG